MWNTHKLHKVFIIATDLSQVPLSKNLPDTQHKLGDSANYSRKTVKSENKFQVSHIQYKLTKGQGSWESFLKTNDPPDPFSVRLQLLASNARLQSSKRKKTNQTKNKPKDMERGCSLRKRKHFPPWGFQELMRWLKRNYYMIEHFQFGSATQKLMIFSIYRVQPL